MGKTKNKSILFAASEAVPFAKTGGMGDVCGALPKALAAMGNDVRLAIPRYWGIDPSQYSARQVLSPMGVQMGTHTVWCEVLEGVYEGIKVYLIEHEHYFGRAGYYHDDKWEYLDNPERFGFFSRACVQLCRDISFKPDIIHCNDWQTALVPVYLKTSDAGDAFFRDTATVFTIHNIGYQGVYPQDPLPFLGISAEHFTEAKLESHGRIHFMKGALFFADGITTVSNSYADELLTPAGGKGLAPYLERRREDFTGILNGADYEHWDPRVDTLIPSNYSYENMKGKTVCKKALQKEFMLQKKEDIPIIGIVSRFVEQKGFQQLMPVIKGIVNDMLVQFAIIGSGEKGLEDFYGGLPAEFPGRIGTWIGYNEKKAHLIEAGADFFIMPSLYEPCGLNQIYSMKYGTLPIVRSIGGLKDTVRQYDESSGTGTGFLFESADPTALYFTVGWAVSTYYDRPHHMRNMQKEAMMQDYSWEISARKYEQVYDKALARRKTWK